MDGLDLNFYIKVHGNSGWIGYGRVIVQVCAARWVVGLFAEMENKYLEEAHF